MTKYIAVLLTCHNRKEKTLSCLTALYNCIIPDGYDFDVFLVDDGSKDGTSDAIRKNFPQVNIIHGTGNLFWNRGMYLAWETAAKTNNYDYYLWLNDDTCLYPHAVEELTISSESENNRKIICGSTCDVNDKQKITYGGRNSGNSGKELIFPNGKKQICYCFNGNIVLIPEYVYKIAGMNDALFHHALGDFDYGLRARKSGIISIVSPSVLGECEEHKVLAGWCNPQTPVLRRLKLLYTPTGNNPFEFFKYENRHNGLLNACFHFITNHLRAICPALWKK
ncbi:MAG: glycosyltransferase family 2 protein [Prevotellaceae bacterium]|jgi:GT2 family glycosyltransferase|nr:glycosyltransferase family 2 protein [Prevotellaceae bacterium]